jgi:hypothetical protein
VIEIEFEGTVFQADDGDAWHWVELQEELTEVVERFSAGPRSGWGSRKVSATIGATTWDTSLFLSTDGTYLLPLKQPVRRAEEIEAGDDVQVVVRL